MIIGVTGPSGAGKSLFCSMLAERGFRVLDCDKIYHDIISSPCECTSALEARFGHGIINENGGVDRSTLADIVFKDNEALTDLNSITLGYVKKEVKRMAYDAVSAGTPVVIDAPTLFEAGCEKLCDITVGLLAPREKRAVRLESRDGAVRSKNQIASRIDASKPDDFYISRCDIVWRNDSDTDALAAFADRLTHDASSHLA